MTDPLDLGVTLAVFAVAVKAVVDALRRQWPRLDGLAVQVVALLVAAGSAWAFDLHAAEALLTAAGATAGRAPPAVLDFLITGGAIAAAAGLFAERAGRSGPAGPMVVEVDAEGRRL
jgi:hypothetical protein